MDLLFQNFKSLLKAKTPLYFLLVCFVLANTSCTQYNLLRNGEPVNNEAYEMGVFYQSSVTLFKIGDKLSISVWDHEELSIGSIYSINDVNEASGKWVIVNSNGEVKLPKIGAYKILGQSKEEAEAGISQLLAEDLVNPVVDIKIHNRGVTVLGEVGAPGVVDLGFEDLRLFEVLGKAGGFTGDANSKKVKLLRIINNVEHELTIDLTDKTDFRTKNIIVKDDDMIYVPHRRAKEARKIATTAAPIVGIVTSVAILVSQVK